MFSEINSDAVEVLIKERNTLKRRVELLEAWLQAIIGGDLVLDFCRVNNLSHIAIYSYGKYGKLLKMLFDKSEIIVDYIIDKNADNMKSDIEIPLISFNDTWQQVDAIFIPTIGIDVTEIEDKIHKDGICTKVFELFDVCGCQNIYYI